MRLVLLAALVCSAFVIHSCNITTSAPAPGKATNNDKPYPAPAVPGVRPPNGNLTLKGLVKDENGTPLSGVDVYYYGSQSLTNSRGEFAMPGVNSYQRIIVQFRKAGYFPMDAGFRPDYYGNQNLHVALARKTFIQSFAASKGDTVKAGELTITVPPAAFFLNGQPYNGQVNMFGKYLDVRNPLFYEMMPGRDLEARDLFQREGTLISYGAFLLEALTPSGDKLTSEDGSGKNNTTFFKYCIPTPSNYTSGASAWVFSYQFHKWIELTSAGIDPLTGLLCFNTPSFLTGCNFDTFTLTAQPDDFYLSFDYCTSKLPLGSTANLLAKLTYQNGSEWNIRGSFVYSGADSTNILSASLPLSSFANLTSITYFVNNIQVYKTTNPAELTNPFYYTNRVPGPFGPYCPN
jgi:hypothetical protein